MLKGATATEPPLCTQRLGPHIKQHIRSDKYLKRSRLGISGI